MDSEIVATFQLMTSSKNDLARSGDSECELRVTYPDCRPLATDKSALPRADRRSRVASHDTSRRGRANFFRCNRPCVIPCYAGNLIESQQGAVVTFYEHQSGNGP